MATRTTREWLDLFASTSVPTIVVNSLEDLADDPHLKAVGFWQTLEHPTEGTLRLAGFPVNFFDTPAAVRRHTPRLGEHTRELLRVAGLSDAQVDALIDSGASSAAL
jgi:crotonobetainyl-CoA:carnitine CoA-transferase CaiB-like acyl-CoA transferase